MVTGWPSIVSDDLAQRFVLLVLARHVLAVHEQEFGAQQADAFGAGVHRHLRPRAAARRWRGARCAAVLGDGGQLAQAAELAFVALQLVLAALIFGDQRAAMG